MRIIYITGVLLFAIICPGQTTWFKHLPGFHARTSLLKNDTILTTGTDVVKKSFGYKFCVFLSWNKINKDSISYLKINLDTLEKDSTRTTLLSSNYNASVAYKEGSLQLLRLSDGAKKDRAFLMTFDKFYSNEYKLEEFKVDTFTTAINNILTYPTDNISFIRYAVVEKPLEVRINSDIFKGKTKIKEYNSFSLEGYEISAPLKNNKSDNSFFFKFTKMWDWRGSPHSWEEYIIKMDTLGNELWRCQPNNRDSINPEGMQFVQKDNGNLLVSWTDGWYRPYMAPPPNANYQLAVANRNSTVWFAEIDTAGKVLWRKNIRKFLAYKLNRATDHELVHVKAIPVKDGILWTGNYAWVYWHNYLLKTDYNGNPKWYREYELYPANTAKSEFIVYDVTAANDGGYVITGEYQSGKGNLFWDGCQKATIIKVDSFGCLEPGCQKADSVPVSIRPTQYLLHCKVYPNPANETVTIQLPLNIKGTYSLEVFSMTGKLIEKIAIHESTVLNTIKYPNGFYLFKIYNEQTHDMETHKISINH